MLYAFSLLTVPGCSSNVCMHVYVHACMCVCMYVQVCMHMCVCVHACVYMCEIQIDYYLIT